jgi:hypothetical protein
MPPPAVRCEAPRSARRPTRGTSIPTICRPSRRWIATSTTGSPTSTGTGERFVSDGDQGTITVASGSTSKLGAVAEPSFSEGSQRVSLLHAKHTAMGWRL